MNKILTILLIITSINLISQTNNFDSVMFDDVKSLDKFNEGKTHINFEGSLYYGKNNINNSNNMLGPGVLLGGTAFLVAGILTSTNRVVGTPNNVYYDINRYLAIGTGTILIPMGLVITISNK